MPAGRPRTVSLPKEEMIKLGEEMIKWVDENEPLHLSEWYTIEKMFTYKQWDAMTKIPEFLPYYEKALKKVSKNYINGTIAPAIANRFLRIYFQDVKNSENEVLDNELKRQKDLIDYKVKKENNTLVSPIQDQIDLRHEVMMLKDELRKEREKNANK